MVEVAATEVVDHAGRLQSVPCGHHRHSRCAVGTMVVGAHHTYGINAGGCVVEIYMRRGLSDGSVQQSGVPLVYHRCRVAVGEAYGSGGGAVGESVTRGFEDNDWVVVATHYDAVNLYDIVVVGLAEGYAHPLSGIGSEVDALPGEIASRGYRAIVQHAVVGSIGACGQQHAVHRVAACFVFESQSRVHRKLHRRQGYGALCGKVTPCRQHIVVDGIIIDYGPILCVGGVPAAPVVEIGLPRELVDRIAYCNYCGIASAAVGVGGGGNDGVDAAREINYVQVAVVAIAYGVGMA